MSRNQKIDVVHHVLWAAITAVGAFFVLSEGSQWWNILIGVFGLILAFGFLDNAFKAAKDPEGRPTDEEYRR